MTPKIFYQSMEYGDRFTKKSLNWMNFEDCEMSFTLTSGNIRGKKKQDDTNPYHTHIQTLLVRYFQDLEADIVVLGEYMDHRYASSNDLANVFTAQGYKIQGVVGVGDRGTRAMTIYSKYSDGNKDYIPGCRISTLDGQLVRINYLDSGFKDARNREEEDTSERLQALSECAIEPIGQCIEIMIYNQYILVTHLKKSGDKARENLCGVLKSSESNDLCAGDYRAKYIVTGDLNAGLQQQSKTFSAQYNNIQFISNTDYSAPGAIGEYDILQYALDSNSVTSSGQACHDGTYLPNQLDEKIKVTPLSALWPLVKLSNKHYAIMSDHKGFLLQLDITHDPNSPATALTRPPSPECDVVVIPTEKKGDRYYVKHNDLEGQGVAPLGDTSSDFSE